jgi:hypothetical protein
MGEATFAHHFPYADPFYAAGSKQARRRIDHLIPIARSLIAADFHILCPSTGHLTLYMMSII